MKTILSICLLGTCLFSSAQSTNHSFVHQTVTRNYIVHLPPGYPDGSAYSLVINMHGYGTNGNLQESLFEMSPVADTGNFIVVYPDGISASWNAGQLWSYATGIDDVSFISTLIDTMVANYTIDTNRVYATGMSNGGFMSYRLACELADKIAAIASVTGVMSDSVYNSCQTSRPVPVMHMHGTTDPTVDYNGDTGQQSVDSCISYWVQRNNCSPTPVVTAIPDIVTSDNCTADKFVYGGGDDNSEVVFFKITNGGHTWPGGPDLSGFGYGYTNMDFIANGEIWLFFRKHTLPTPTAVSEHIKTRKPSLSIWPNPGSDMVVLGGVDLKKSVVTVVNLLGQVVIEKPLSNTSGSASLDISNLEKGVYVIKVANTRETLTEVLVKQ